MTKEEKKRWNQALGKAAERQAAAQTRLDNAESTLVRAFNRYLKHRSIYMRARSRLKAIEADRQDAIQAETLKARQEEAWKDVPL